MSQASQSLMMSYSGLYIFTTFGKKKCTISSIEQSFNVKINIVFLDK